MRWREVWEWELRVKEGGREEEERVKRERGWEGGKGEE